MIDDPIDTICNKLRLIADDLLESSRSAYERRQGRRIIVLLDQMDHILFEEERGVLHS